jgi:hypothetical protein
MLSQWLRYQEVCIVKRLKALPGSPIANVQHYHKSVAPSLFALHDFVFFQLCLPLHLPALRLAYRYCTCYCPNSPLKSLWAFTAIFCFAAYSPSLLHSTQPC